MLRKSIAVGFNQPIKYNRNLGLHFIESNEGPTNRIVFSVNLKIDSNGLIFSIKQDDREGYKATFVIL